MLLNRLSEFLLSKTIILNPKERRRVNKGNIVLHILKEMVDWLLGKKIKIWGVDAVSTDHPMDLPIGRFLGKGTFGQCDRVRAKAEKKFYKEKYYGKKKTT